jgi:hypothetical protein
MRALERKAHRFIEDGVPETGTCSSPLSSSPKPAGAFSQRGARTGPAVLVNHLILM